MTSQFVYRMPILTFIRIIYIFTVESCSGCGRSEICNNCTYHTCNLISNFWTSDGFLTAGRPVGLIDLKASSLNDVKGEGLVLFARRDTCKASSESPRSDERNGALAVFLA
jgi:hypothetical protein